MKKSDSLTIITIIFLAAAMLSSGCSGSGSGGSQTGAKKNTSFKISGASQLVALSSTVAATNTSSKSTLGVIKEALFGKPLLKYEIVNQGLSDQEVRARAKGNGSKSTVMGAVSTPVKPGTNLISITEDGVAELAIKSDYMIKVMYSVTDPSGEYVYLALDPGFIKPDGNDYTPFIAENNCAFFKVTIADNTSICVKEGVYIQPIDEVYLQRISSNVKPIQFDGQGNIYFPATTFSRRCDSSGSCTMSAADWNPRIYRVSAADGAVIALTQDNQKISYYITLTTGEIAYQSIDANGNTTLYLWQQGVDPTINPNGKTVNLTGSTVGVDYFTADSYNTIMWGGWTESGIRFARPASSSSGLIEKAVLDTRMYSTGQGGDTPFGDAFPALRVIVGDDGKLYGVFQEFSQEDDPNDPNLQKFFETLKVYEVLPYNPIPKVQVKIPELNPLDAMLGKSKTWQQWLGTTPFQVSQGFIYYKERTEKIGFGNHDVIKMVSLTDRRTITLLENDAYEIYTWRLRGDKLYFSALDLNQTVVVAGEINTSIVKANPLADPLSTFMKVNPISSAIGATSRVQDIESMAALQTDNVTDPPAVTQFVTAPENIYSASIEFNKIMNKASVEENLTLTEVSSNTSIATMKVWINDFLHLIPDLQPNNVTPPAPNDSLLDLAFTKPLSFSTAYGISVGADAADTASPPQTLGVVSSASFTTRPEFGWFIASDQVAKFYGSQKDNNGNMPVWHYLISSGATGSTEGLGPDFRLQFRVKNKSWGGIGFTYYDADGAANGNPYVKMRLRDYISTEVRRSYINCWGGTETRENLSADYNSQLWNGEWMYYRIDVYGSYFQLSYSSTENGTYTVIPVTRYFYDNACKWTNQTVDKYDLLDPRGGTVFALILSVQQPLDFDDLKIWNLGADGTLGASVFTDSFSYAAGAPPPPFFLDNYSDAIGSGFGFSSLPDYL